MFGSFHFVSFLRIVRVKVSNCVRDRFTTSGLWGFDPKDLNGHPRLNTIRASTKLPP